MAYSARSPEATITSLEGSPCATDT
jgi:hypothetical protein